MNPYLLLIVGGLGLVGCLILLFMGMQLLREERAKKEGATEAEAPAGGETPAPAADPAPPAAAPARRPLTAFSDMLGLGARPRGNAHEVLRVLRDNLTGRLVIEIAGRRYGQASDVDDPAVYQGLLTTLRDLHDFAGVEGAHAVDPAQRPAASFPAAPPAVRHPAPPPPRSSAPTAAATPKPLPPPTMNPFKQMQVLRELAKIPETPTLTIAEQIDEVLQARLLGTSLANRGIRMRPGPRGDAIFEFDGNSYTAVDDVPDEEVRQVIRAAIAAWESK